MGRIYAAMAILAGLALMLWPQFTLWRQAWPQTKLQDQGTNLLQSQPAQTPIEDTSLISPTFSDEAWAALLPIIRQTINSSGAVQGSREAETAVANLRNAARTKGEWLLWSQLNDYSLARLLANASSTGTTAQVMRQPEACADGITEALRLHKLEGRIASCERVSLAAALQVQMPATVVSISGASISHALQRPGRRLGMDRKMNRLNDRRLSRSTDAKTKMIKATHQRFSRNAPRASLAGGDPRRVHSSTHVRSCCSAK